MATISRAEQALLESLKKERVTNPGKTSKFTALKTMKLDTSNIIPASMLKRPEHIEEYERQKEEVAALPGKQQPVQSREHSEGYQKIIKKDLEKRDRHNKALKDYESKVVIISEELEKKLIAKSHAATEAIQEVDQKIRKMLEDLRPQHILVTRSYQFIQNAWSSIQAVLRKRTEAVAGFAAVLEGVEADRAKQVGGELRRLVEDLIAIGHKLPDDMERIAAQEAFELNSVLISNRLIMHEMMARLEVRDCEVGHWARAQWEECLEEWRQLRHTKAVTDFQEALNAPNFTNPFERQSLLARVRAGQVQRNQRRHKLIAQLGARKVPELKSEHVQALLQEFDLLHTEEVQAENDLERELELIRQNKLTESKALKEALRTELHDYEALEQEPDLKATADFFDKMVSDSSLDDFFRTAGGLKPELKALIQDLQSPDLNYPQALGFTIERTKKLLCGVHLEEVLEKQGKTQIRRFLKDLVERFRKSGKLDIISLLPALVSQVSDLAAVNDLDPMLKKLFEESLAELQVVTAELEVGTNTWGNKNSAGRSAIDESRTNSTKGSARGLTKRSLQKTNTAGRSASVPAQDDKEVDLVTIRSVQRRIGLLVCACELSTEAKLMLSKTLQSLVQKMRCNNAIDALVSSDSISSLPVARDKEFEELSVDILRAFNIRAYHLTSVADRLCHFFLNSTKIAEMHLKNEEDLDEVSMDEMFDLKEEFRIEMLDREQALSSVLERVRKAADQSELASSFQNAIEMLDGIETAYRTYHHNSTASAERHPTAVSKENKEFETAVCVIMGLEVFVPAPPPPPKTAPPVVELSSSEILDDRTAEVESVTSKKSSKTSKSRAGSPSKDRPASRAASPTKDKHPKAGSPPPRSRETTAAKANTKSTPELPQPEPVVEETIPEEPPVVIWRAQGGSKDFVERKTAAEIAALFLSEEEDQGKDPNGARKGSEQKAVSGPDESNELTLEEELIQVAPWWMHGFVPLTPEEFEELDEEGKEQYLDKRDAVFITLSDEEMNHSLPIHGIKDKKLIAANNEKRHQYASMLDEVTQRRLAKAELEARLKAEREMNSYKFQMAYIPVDAAGTKCIEAVQIEPKQAVDLISEFRDALVVWMENHEQERDEKADKRCNENKAVLTEELEDRLRSHWPRKGRVEVNCRAPREGELVTHTNRAQRYAKGLLDKHEAQEVAFQKLVKETEGFGTKFLAKLHDLMERLPTQTSIASLQGVETQQRKLASEFEAEFENQVEKLSAYLSTLPEGLVAGCQGMIEQCRTFDQGGDFDLTEIEFLRESLEIPLQRIRHAVEEREETLQELSNQKDQSLGAPVTEFRAKYNEALVELSLKEGLGQKYGGPRRRAQERLRTVITRDESAGDLVDQLLRGLESLCEEAKRMYLTRQTPLEAHKRNSHATEKSHPLSIRVASCLLSLRAALYQRVSYLEFLRQPGSVVLTDIQLPAELLVDEGVKLLPSGTFVGAMGEIEQQCKKETLELYKQEKREELLGDDGIPESLKLWLQESRSKALGPDGHWFTACKRLQKQVNRLEKLVAKWPVPPDPQLLAGPAACIIDLLYRRRGGARRVREEAEAGFAKQLAIFEAAKKKHETTLRPQLGQPDNAAELEALVQIERGRQEEVKQALKEFQSNLLQNEKVQLQKFCQELVDLVTMLLSVLDSIVMSDHLARLPGEQAEQVKRKGLKRLRKAKRAGKEPLPAEPRRIARKASIDEAKDDEEEEDEEADFVKPWEFRDWKPIDMSNVNNEIQSQIEMVANASFKSFVTTAHRELIRRRDDVFVDYLEYYNQAIKQLHEKYSKLHDAEEAWGENWEVMCQRLKNMHDA